MHRPTLGPGAHAPLGQALAPQAVKEVGVLDGVQVVNEQVVPLAQVHGRGGTAPATPGAARRALGQQIGIPVPGGGPQVGHDEEAGRPPEYGLSRIALGPVP